VIRCPFCDPPAERLVCEGPDYRVLWDGYPVAEGHALVVTRRHVAGWFEASPSERAGLLAGVERAREAIETTYRPDGYNIGVNVGEAAGQTVFHLHVHVIPRYRGDVPRPRGGVRHVIPGRGDYGEGLADEAGLYRLEDVLGGERPPHERGLIAGEDDTLLAHLAAHLARAEGLDVAVAFVQPSGVERLRPVLTDLLRRGGRLRLVTGDYLDVTDPYALSTLCDLATTHRGRVELRVFECAGRATFHPKAYIIRGPGPRGVAFVGSSNVTEPALAGGLEWSYRVLDWRDRAGFEAVAEGFERLFRHRATQALDDAWIERYRARRRPPAVPEHPLELRPAPPPSPPEPHSVQREALAALARTREEGNRAGLVVMATGLGKTWLAAFDASRPEFDRVLFVAHREEILAQTAATFRRIRPRAHIGGYGGGAREPDADVVLASIQTLSRAAHLHRFARDAFDYVVIDEFHHAHARTYRRVIEHFEPRFLLGLTATPERSDGGDLLALCAENLVYRCDLAEAIRRDLLVPFRYFGVPDEVDYANIPWRSSRFDEEELTRAVATRARADNVLDQHRRRGGRRTLAFCVSQRHADFMREHFRAAGLSAASVHAGPGSDGRALAVERLAGGELDVLFAVDMFNEGLDVPDVDTVMMLRPTGSRVLWLQQLGRGLRKAKGKERLTVIDYIGNHRTFLVKPQTLFDLAPGDASIERTLAAYERGELELPPGCEVTYDLRAVEILRALLRTGRSDALERLRAFYRDFSERHGHRPLAVEAFHEGYNPRAARRGAGSWLDLVAAENGLAAGEQAALEEARAGAFLRALETTPMTRSYKMLLVLGALDAGLAAGAVPIEAVCEGVCRRARRSPALARDLGEALDDAPRLRVLLEKNPIAAFLGGAGTGGTSYLRYEAGRLETTFRLPERLREPFADLAREICEWRLAEYLERARHARGGEYLCNVSHAQGRPILFLPDRHTHPDLPRGWIPLIAGGERYEGNFVKVALNVVRRPGERGNLLPEILRGWFGEEAGRPGRRHRVWLRREGQAWTMGPVAVSSGDAEAEM